MKRIQSILPAIALLSALACAARAEVRLSAVSDNPKGWMAGGWGGYRFTFRNESDAPARLVRWKAHWQAKGKPVGDPWSGDLDNAVPPGGEHVKEEIGYLPPEVAEAARPEAPVMVGTFTLRQGDAEADLSFRITIPEARLPEPTRVVSGKHVALDLMESRYKTFTGRAWALRWLDQAYAAMVDLTGAPPYDGRVIVLKEAPPHPWYAYAGNPVIVNTEHVGKTLEEINSGVMPFGLIHEVGHDFDVYGDWYIWDSPSAEFHANFKLAYAFDRIPDKKFRVNLRGFGGHAYPPQPEPLSKVSGRQFVDAFFTFFGDPYLADSGRKWESLSSDELHSFFQRIQVVYGWDVFRAMYRTYQRLDRAGAAKPETSGEKVTLMAAILSEQAKVDLVPVFRRWRMPVTAEGVAAMRARYNLGAPAGETKP